MPARRLFVHPTRSRGPRGRPASNASARAADAIAGTRRRAHARPLPFAITLVGSLPIAARAHAQTPLSYLEAHGGRAFPINALTWGLIGISLAVIVMSIVLVLAGTFRGPTWHADALPGRLDLEPLRRGAGWITIGVAVSTLVLFATTVWTVVTLADVSDPPGGDPKINLEVIGHQWWWEVRYLGATPDQTFRTANEIHVPVGEPVGVRLKTVDVIHSFWIPALTGKTDLIPGQTNTTWFSADRPGVYRGQCTEYCGQQHAHMGFEVIADPSQDFEKWRTRQIEPLRTPSSGSERRDLDTFVAKCGVCHSVRGTPATGVLGPDLSHLMSRPKIAAAALPNTIGSLSAWIADPQHVKPGALMPRLDLSGPELTRIRRFLETLR